ncbi:Ada metal-binding domain-containing protein [Pseudodesulfovibrio cashew]|uniref:Ada metal-binding domain-containing protein n=1 Tax=Pseudodesulfovibrio cashew TaxID=2678688 RepID=UPI001F5591A4|nr:Ada metal-binding domain-containing protein [Pseudodesulfovibrio cashew]
MLLCVLALAWGVAGEPSLPLTSEALAASVYHGNKRSHVFHQPGCRYFDCKNCVVVFTSRQEAIGAGFRPCKICRP